MAARTTLVILLLQACLHLGSPQQGASCPSSCTCSSYTGNQQVATCVLSDPPEADPLTGLHTGLTVWLRLVCTGAAPSNIQLPAATLSSLTNLQRLDIVGCHLGHVDDTTLSALPPSVTNLTLSASTGELLTLADGWLGGMPNMRHLELSNNELLSLPIGGLCGPFVSLNLSSNYFDYFGSLGLTCPDDDDQCDVCLPNLQVLDISDNDVDELTDALVDSMPELREFYAYNNLLELFDQGAFQGLSKLEVIDLTWNELDDKLEPGLFQNLPLLSIVKLKVNSLSGLDSDTFTNSPNVRYLDLTSNDIYGDTAGQFDFLHDLAQLEYLDLSANDLESLSQDMLQNKPNLKTLRLLYTSIIHIPAGVFTGAPNLESLNLGGNELREIAADAFSGLANLKTLVLAGCSLNRIHDDAFTHTPQLETLYLFKNVLPSVPASMGQLSQLKVLYLTDNSLSAVDPSVYGTMNSLQTVFMDGNPITVIPADAFGANSNVETLDFSHSTVSTIHKDAFRGMGKLKHLWLNSNQISVLGRAFSQVAALEQLDLSFNNIYRVEAQEFPASLQNLNLSRNSINYVNEEAFNNLLNLKVVDLSWNSIQVFSPAMINTMSDVAPDVILRGNPQHTCLCASIQQGTPVLCSNGYITDNGQQHNFTTYLHKVDTVCNYDTDCDRATCTCCTGSGCSCRFTCPPGCSCAKNYDRSYQAMSCRDLLLTAIPATLPHTSTTLDLYGNNYEAIESNAFGRYVKLLKLDLSSSQIVEVKPNAFQELVLLQELSLADNNIQTIQQGAFDGLGSLRTLELQGNGLMTIDTGSLSGLASLRELYLHDNNLVSIDLSSLSLGPPGLRVSLHGNNWACDCKFGAYLQRWLKASADRVTNPDLVCGRPVGDQLAGEGTDLQQVDFSSCGLPEGNSARAGMQQKHKLGIIVGVTVPVILLALAAAIFLGRKFCRLHEGTPGKPGIFHKHLGRTWKRNNNAYDGYNLYGRPSLHSVYDTNDLADVVRKVKHAETEA